MSRETDSSSSGPQGRGGAAYPSGTPPYGTRQYPSAHPQEEPPGGSAGAAGPGGAQGDGGDDAAPDEPRTETTLTTRIRINIPGSRPIPPVVVRKPMGEGDGDGDAPGAESGGPGNAGNEATQAVPRWTPPGAPGGDAAPGDAPGDGGDKAASDWFAPRKPPAPTPPGGTPVPGASGAGPSGAGPASPAPSGPPAPGSGGPGPGQPAIPYLNDPPAASAPRGRAFPDDHYPGGPDGSGGLDGDAATVNSPLPGTGPLGAGPGAPGGDPFAPGNDPFAPQAGSGAPGRGRGGESFGPGSQGRGAPFTPPAGAAAGPAAGSPAGQPGGPNAGVGPVGGPPPGSVPFPGFHAPDGSGRPPGADAGPPAPPAGPTTGPATGAMRMPGADPGEGRSGYRPASGGTGAGHVSGETLVSGVPAGPAGTPTIKPPSPPADSGAPAPKASSAASAPKRKGRSKPKMAVMGLVGLAAVLYAAGLLMNHADVPNGTTVLGVDIGGKSRDEAVKALDAAVADRGTAPLKLNVGGRTVELKPALAGLSIDTERTVAQVAHRDYDPISVVGSLFGGKTVVQPVIPVDQEKLDSQLDSLAPGGTGSPTDGMVKFVDGTPVAVAGKPYQAVDAALSDAKVTDAYVQRAQTGQDQTVTLPVTTHQPQVTQADLTQAIKTIGDPAMSGRITVVAGGRSVPFSPQKSLSKILTIVAVPGTDKMTLHIDLNELQQLYGNAFDGVLLERGTGTKTPVTPQDVASAMLPELSKTAAEKTATITNVAQ
ncbi:hypothetical protein K7472_04690 [Streptomyces sp. PTM05]|uniref:Peptidoglycan binding domain-containing protein n=1 Tax=Streptantibioticus parmotrematis TaxID=2873249 RepID=A0ABS7QLT8_9ACTN|nr:hypothetical protein [Streptantibioticus parmotrematis]MBY8884143.1 hypothetical protein [Streptantibioticus parmotrematis]